MENDCRIIYNNKRVHEFSSKNLVTALKWLKDSGQMKNVYSVETPWCVFQLLWEDTEAFKGYEYVRDELLGADSYIKTEIPEDLQ